MTKKILLSFIASLFIQGLALSQECAIDITRPSADTTICLGDSVYLKSEGSCDVFMNNGFENGIGVGWSSTAANPTFPSKGCDEEYKGPGEGPNGPYLWVGATASLERTIITDSFNVTIGNCYVKFWMRFGRQNNSGPCEDPEDVGPGGLGSATGEGVHLQYSIDDGMTWLDFAGINEFAEGPNVVDPPFTSFVDGTGGYWDPTEYCNWPLPSHCDERYDTSTTYWWHEYSCPIPPPAETTATRFRFAQLNTDLLGYDTWGLDEVKIFCSNNQNVVWGHGPTVFNPPIPVAPTDTTEYWVRVFDTLGNFATDTVTIYVAAVPNTNLGPDTTICWYGTNTAIFDAGAGFDSYLWNTGDTTQIIYPDTTGLYIVEVWNVTCFDTDSVFLTVIPATVAYAGTDESVCQGDAWDFHNSTNNPSVISADSVLWFGGIGTFSDPTDSIPIYTTDPTELGPLSLGIIAYGSGPCGNDTNYMILTVDTVPIVDYTSTPIDSACVLDDILFQGTSNCAITTWHWDFGDGNTANGQNVTHAFAATGTYIVKLHVFNAFNCVDSIEYPRHITDPNIDFTHSPAPSCENDTVFFDGQGDVVTYADWIWDFGDGTPNDTGRSVYHVYPNFGTYSVTLSVCNKDTIHDHTVIETSTADAGSDEIICEHYSHDFSTSATQPTATSYDSLRWSGGLGTFNDATLLLPVYTPAAGELGDVTLTLISFAVLPCSNDTSSMILSILDGPEADFTYIPNDSLCVGELISFSGSSSTNIISWDWDFGDGGIASGQNVSYAYTADGFYDVMLVVINDSACVDTVTYTLEIHILPDADFTITPGDSVCLNTPMTFDGNSSTNIINWDWDLGDGTFATGQSINHTYAASGTYDVYLYVFNEHSCTDTVWHPVTIFDLPTCDFTISPNDTSCINELVYFDGTGSADITSWDWDFDDGNFASGQNVTNTFLNPGTYNVMLVVSNGDGCNDTTIHQRVVVDVTIDFTITPSPSCLGDTVWFNGIGSAAFTDWIWDFGDGSPQDTGHDVYHLYATYDTFDITLSVCSETVIYSHIVQEPASAFAGSDESVCEYYSFDFSTSSSVPTANAYDSLRWFGGLGTFNDPTFLHPVYTPAAGEIGPVQLWLISLARIPCSNDTSFMWLTVLDGPEADFTISPGDSICVDEVIAFDATSSTNITSWLWDFGDGNTGSGQNVVHSYTLAGLYDITLVVFNDDACTDTVVYSIEVFELPVANFTVVPGNSICSLEELTFNGSSSTTILNWYWDFDDGNTATGQNVTHTFIASGTYNVSLIVYNENSCRDTMVQQVNIFELPVCDFTISPNDTSCVNELVTFNGTGTADIISWDWDFDDGNVGNGQVVTHIYTNPGTYNISLIVSNSNGCLDTMIHQRVVVEPVIDFNMVLSPTCEGYTVDFFGIGNYSFTNYVWDFGDGFNDIGKNVSHIYTTPNTYTVTLTFCTSQVQHDILVNPLPVAYAGQDTTSCEDVPFDLSTMPDPPAASNYSSILWFGGLGTFNDPTLVAPIYTPAPGELGFVTLYMVAYGIAPCYNDTSSMTIEVIEGAYAFAGSDEHSCQGVPFNFANSSVPPQAWNELTMMWSGGAGFFVDPTVEVPIYVPAPGELGPITLTFIASNILNCDSMDQMILTIHPVYEETHNFNLCFGDSLQLPGGSWQYTTGIYYDTLLSVWGCDSVVITNLFVYPKIDADFSISPNDSTCIGEDVFFTKTGTANLISWNWDFGDGTFSTALNPSHSYNSPGVFTVVFSYTDDMGCQDETSHEVFVYTHPDVDFTASASSACINAEITFYGISADDILFWDWDFGDGSTGSGQNVTHTYTIFGAIQVTLTVTATNLCQSSITKPIFVAEPPTADFTYNIMTCDTIQFTDLSTAPQGFFLVEWLWYFDDGTTSNLQHPAHAYASGGVYNVSLVVSADSAGLICTDSITKPVLVPDRPTVYFTWTPEPTCLGETTTFFGTSGNPITEWYWDFDDGNFASVQNPEHIFAASGIYNVTLFATDANGCWDTVAHAVTITDIPDVSFTVDPNPTCAGEQTSFSGSSTSNVSTWLWDFGDGGTSIQQNPVHVFAAAGSYNVILYAGDTNNCFNHTSQLVVVNPMPLADFSHSGPVCSGDSVFFYNMSSSPNGSIAQWIWDFGDGNSVTVNAPNDPDVAHVYGAGSTFQVTLTVMDADSCSNFIIKPVSVTPGPIADFNYVGNCSGQPVEFTDISSQNGGSVIVSWFWEFGDPASGGLNTSTLQDPTHLFSTAGTFDVLLLVTNVEGCSDTILLPVDVNMVPEVSFTTDSDSACVDTEISFFGQSSSTVTWSWDFGDGGISVLQNPVHVYIDAGIYNVTLTVEDGNGCINAVTNSVYVNPLPIADFTFSSLLCSGSPVDFTDISSPMNAYMLEWHWQFGDGSDTVIYAPSSGDVSHTYASPGAYTVLLSVLNSNFCEDSIAYDISVIQGPEAIFEYSGDVCQGGTVQFTDLSLGFGSVIQVWLWSFGDPQSGANNSSSLQNPTHMYAQSGTYDVSLSVTSNTGCTHNVVQQVEISPSPPVDWFVNPDTTCFGELTFFFTDPDSTNIAEVVSYSWNFGDPSSGINDTSNLQNPVHMFTAPGTYTITLGIVNIDGCENTSIHDIEIKNVPVADYEYQQACLGDSTLFTDMSISQSSVITSWQWNFGDPASGAMNTSTLQNTRHVFTDLGTYLVELIATDYFGCSDTIVKTLVVDYAPTAFFKHNQPCDPPGFVYFNDSSYTQAGAAPIVEWLWELEPGYFSSEINPVYTFDEYDTCYVVNLVVTDANGCESLHVDSVCVDAPLGVDFFATRVCYGVSSFFDGQYLPAGDSIISWTWDFDDGNVVVGDSDTTSYFYAQSGTYYVTLTIENDKGCEKSVIHEVIVDALPAVDFVFSAAICDDPTYFTDMTDPGYGAVIDTWLWNFGDPASGPDNTSTQQNPQHLYPPTGSTYLVSLVVSNTHGCVDSLEQSLTKGLCLQAIFELASGAQCNNTEVCFVDSSYILGDNYFIQSWHWDFGDGQSMSYDYFVDSVCYTYNAWGEYMVTLIVIADAAGVQFSDTTQRLIMVSTVPSAEMAFEVPCAMSNTKFFDISAGNGLEVTGWQWDFGDPYFVNDTSSLKDPVYSYSEAGTYSVQLIVENENGCMDTVLTDLQVFNTPEAAFSNEIACAGGLTIFTDESIPADADLVYWLWSFGTGETSGQQSPVYVYPDTGNYIVQMLVTDENQCSNSATGVVNVFPVPLSAFDILDNYENVQGQILLDNLSESAVHYEWDFGNGDTSELFSPVVRYENDGTYLIELIAWNDNNCPDTAYMEYVIVFQGLYVPTGFTPTSTNPELRLFKPAGVNLEYYQVTLINQWGNIVWQSNKLDNMGRPMEGWDGITNGEPQPTGTYMWSISAKFKDGTSWNGTDAGDGNTKTFGTVLLIR